MTADIAEFARSITEKRKIVEIAMDCLYFIADNPDARDSIGICWSNDSSAFLICIRTFSSFVGKKPNTVRRNLRDHGFQRLFGSERIPALLRGHRYAAWSHPNLRGWLPREQIGPFPYHGGLGKGAVPEAGDQLWESSELLQGRWPGEGEELTEEEKWPMDLPDDREF
jgi:hypothetical protein